MADSNSERKDTRDVLLILVGLAFAISLQSLAEALKTVYSLYGYTQTEFLETQVLLFVAFLTVGLFLARLLHRLREPAPERHQTAS